MPGIVCGESRHKLVGVSFEPQQCKPRLCSCTQGLSGVQSMHSCSVNRAPNACG